MKQALRLTILILLSVTLMKAQSASTYTSGGCSGDDGHIVHISSFPDGATVEVDGVLTSLVTPADVHCLPQGTHHITVAVPNWNTTAMTINVLGPDVKGNARDTHVSFSLLPLLTSGPQGPAGPTGPQGPQGLQGPAGPGGTVGPGGITGPQGPAGATGATGPAGATGMPGPVGAAGPIGPQGPAGQGFAYLPYVAGTNYSAYSVTSENGSSYVALQNNNVDPIADVAANGGNWAVFAAAGQNGLIGAMGPQGLKGDKGDVGATGAAGPQGLVGLTGAAGPAGPIGATGATGPAGPQGFIGSTGPAGPQGPAGPAGIPITSVAFSAGPTALAMFNSDFGSTSWKGAVTVQSITVNAGTYLLQSQTTVGLLSGTVVTCGIYDPSGYSAIAQTLTTPASQTAETLNLAAVKNFSSTTTVSVICNASSSGTANLTTTVHSSTLTAISTQ